MWRKLHRGVTMVLVNLSCAAIVRSLFLFTKLKCVMNAATVFIHITSKLTETNGRAQMTAKSGAIGVVRRSSATSTPSNVNRAILSYTNTATSSRILQSHALQDGRHMIRM